MMPEEQKNHQGPASMQHLKERIHLGFSVPQKTRYINGELKTRTTVNY